MSNEITCTLNNVKYLLFDVLVTNSTHSKKVENKCKKYEAIFQGVKEINRGGFLSSGYMILKVLVPEKNVIAWNNEKTL